MKKNRLTLSELKLTSFIPDTSRLRGGGPEMIESGQGDTVLCAPTNYEGCQETR